MALGAIVIATSHSRHDRLEERVRKRLPDRRVVRLRTQQDLSCERLEEIKPDFVLFPHWSWLIPEDIHTRFDCVIFHMTDLPYGRGGSPLQNLIVRGHKETVVTAFKCLTAFDAGPVYLKRPLSLVGTAEEILGHASVLVEEMIVEIVRTRPVPVPQQGHVVEFKRRRPVDGDIARLETLEQVHDFIRMLDADGYPRAFANIGHLHLEFSETKPGDRFVEAKVRITKNSDS